jgi:exodeoxyribonuclease-3
MKIATYNINGINSRLPVLLRWLKEARPDVVCLQELKTVNGEFPIAAINGCGLPGYLARTKILERRSHPFA